MARVLPTRPSAEALRKEAKALLAAQRSGDPSCCETLRLLHGFESASDADILSADVNLAKAQFALALDYGFSSWPDLMRQVEAAAPPRAQVVRENGRVFIPGLEDYGFGAGDRENTVIASLAGAMRVMGEDYSYADLMGISGAAFRLQFHQPEWCPSSPHADCGFPCGETAANALPYEFVNHWVRKDPDLFEKARSAAVASIDAGLPAIISSQETGLILGYADGGKTLLGRPPYARDSGFNAYGLWIEQLRDARRWEAMEETERSGAQHANGHIYYCLVDARHSAVQYLETIAAEFDAPVAAHLRRAADLYREIAETHLCRECPTNIAPMPYMMKEGEVWTQGMRDAQAAILDEAQKIERRALAEIDRALAAMEQPESEEQ